MATVPTSSSAKVTTPSDQEILITREFDAPRRLVFKAWTTPELVLRWWSGYRGEMTLADFMSADSGMSRSPGHCMTMGTASTMASMVESLGIGLPENAAYPAVDSRRKRLAHLVGNRAV